MEDEVVDSRRVTPARRRDADEPEGGRGDVVAIAATVYGTRVREAPADDRRGLSIGVTAASMRSSYWEPKPDEALIRRCAKGSLQGATGRKCQCCGGFGRWPNVILPYLTALEEARTSAT